MQISKEHQRLTDVFGAYRSRLDTIPDAVFGLTPPGGGWSCAEVYSHIMQATLAASLAIERCTHAATRPSTEKLNMWGWYVMLTARFPPVKTKVPKSVEAKMPTLKISKEEARNLIIKCRKRMDEMEALLASGPTLRRSKHPRLGMLTAAQWFKFIRIHLQHHLKQVDRIAREF